MVDDPSPVAEGGEPSHPSHPSADVRLRLDQVHGFEPAPTERHRAFHARRAGADHQDALLGVRGSLEALGMPTATMLLARRRVLDAAEVSEPVDLHDADVGAGALADLVGAALGDLLREERIGDRGSRGTDQVPRATAHDRGHAVGARQPSDPDDRLRGRLPDPAGPLELIALLEVAGAPRVLAPVGDRPDVHVPEVDEVVSQVDELQRLLDVDPRGAERVHRDPGDDRAVRADGVANRLERLQPEPRALLQPSAVAVGPLVVEGREELHRQVRVRSVHVDDVEPAVSSSHGRVRPPP